MTKPDDIPQDVWNAAIAAFGASEDQYADIARAILADRERRVRPLSGGEEAVAWTGAVDPYTIADALIAEWHEGSPPTQEHLRELIAERIAHDRIREAALLAASPQGRAETIEECAKAVEAALELPQFDASTESVRGHHLANRRAVAAIRALSPHPVSVKP